MSATLKGVKTGTRGKDSYKDGLDTVTRARYLEKIQEIGDNDPYEMGKNSWTKDMAQWPEVTYPDIVNYFVYTQSANTLAELKAFKSLQSYNYFVSGFVQDIGHQSINGKSVFLGKVKHSQRMSDPCLQPWLIIENDGSVVSGHCTCMAGIGEVCSHVGALLFAIEAGVKARNRMTVTEEKAYWMLPTAVGKVEYKNVQDIDFTSAKTKKRKIDEAISEGFPVSGPRQRKLPVVNEPTSKDLDSFYGSLMRTGTKPVILSLVPKFAASFRPKTLDMKYPTVLSELYDETCESLQEMDLLKHCDRLFDTITVSEEEARNCEIVTREQANSKKWFSFRIGRITASRVKRVCRSPPDNPSKSLLKEICYPVSKSFKPTQWGCDHEEDAKCQYIKRMEDKHKNFKWQDCGFVIHPEYPYMGATPDGRVSCDCCDDILVEIKCPYCRRKEEITEAVTCLKLGDGPRKIYLDRNHAYYYQVQCQLFMSGVRSCDFVVWTVKDFFIEKISINDEFCHNMVTNSKIFFKKAVLPELVVKFFTRPLQQATDSQQNLHDGNGVLICICRMPYNKETDNVIGCDNKACPFEWLHFECAGITSAPQGEWFCRDCRK